VSGDFAALHQVVQQLDHFDDHQRLTGTGRHPEAHAVDELLVGHAVIRLAVIGFQQGCEFTLGSRGAVQR